jgi:hypothetical protein
MNYIVSVFPPNLVSYYRQVIESFVYGIRVEGEPARYPESGPTEVRSNDGFFEWSKEYRVGCQAKSGAIFY